MANLKASKRGMRANERNRELNRWKRARIRTSNKKVLGFLKSGEVDKAEAEYKLFASLLDKAAKTKLIKQGNADRKKSRLALQINKAKTAS